MGGPLQFKQSFRADRRRISAAERKRKEIKTAIAFYNFHSSSFISALVLKSPPRIPEAEEQLEGGGSFGHWNCIQMWLESGSDSRSSGPGYRRGYEEEE